MLVGLFSALVATLVLASGAQGVGDGHALSHGRTSARSAGATPPCVVPGQRHAPDCLEPSLPIRAAFYYVWFPHAWSQQGLSLFTHYSPSLGLYSSAASSTIQRHLKAMRYGGIEVGIASWRGPRSTSDAVLVRLLAEVNRTRSPFRWTVYYEPEGNGNPPVSRLIADLTYIRQRYASNRAYLRVGGKFVVFVYASGDDSVAMAERWAAANAAIGNAAYLNLKVFPGYRSVSTQPQSWHQYAPDHAEDDKRGYSFTISPGFYKANETAPRLERDLARWRQDVQHMVASRAPWQLVTTFNEWGEGTAIESASEWQTASGQGAYLDVLHSLDTP